MMTPQLSLGTIVVLPFGCVEQAYDNVGGKCREDKLQIKMTIYTKISLNLHFAGHAKTGPLNLT